LSRVTELSAKLAVSSALMLDDLGGAELVERSAAQIASDVHADRLVAAIARAPVVNKGLADVVVAVLERNPYPLVVGAALLHARTMVLPPESQRRLQHVLLKRIGRRVTALEADMASECLAGAFLLAAAGRISRLAFLSQLEDSRPGEHPLYLRRAARIAGLAWAWDRTPEMRSLLERLTIDHEAGDQALYELAMIHLDEALASNNRDSLLTKLSETAAIFESAIQHSPDFVQAGAMGAILRAVTLFCLNAPSPEVESQLASARRSLGERTLHLDQGAIRAWLRPRIDLETAWYQLSLTLSGLAAALEERSWLRAVPVLERVAAIRRSMIAFMSVEGDTLLRAATERFARSFLANEGLRAHLEAWVQDPAISEDDRLEARGLLQAIELARDAPAGKDSRPVELPTTSGLGQPEVGAEPGPRSRGAINLILGSRYWVTTQKIEEVFASIDVSLADHPDYQGVVRDDIRLLALFVTTFLSHCLDVGSRMSEAMFNFLFDRDGSKPLEIELQRAVYTALRVQVCGFPQHTVVNELPDVAAGRADVAIIRPSWRMVVELKRELDDASRAGIKKYLGQTASYNLTGPRIGILVVLDLCSQKEWALTLQDNCWVESIAGEGDTYPRAVLVFRIPGMRTVPSAARTPS
jgi:hypothetical protein